MNKLTCYQKKTKIKKAKLKFSNICHYSLQAHQTFETAMIYDHMAMTLLKHQKYAGVLQADDEITF